MKKKRSKIMLPSSAVIERVVTRDYGIILSHNTYKFRYKGKTFYCRKVVNLLFDFIVLSLMGKEMSFWEQGDGKS